MNVTQLTKRAEAAPCAACEIRAVLGELVRTGAWSKAQRLKKSPAVRAVFVHTCERGEA